MITRRKQKVRFALLVLTGVALTTLLASELLPSRGKQPHPVRAEWVEIGVATDGTKAFVNRRSITETGARVALWQRFTLGRPKPHTGAAEAVEQLVIYNCGSRIVSTLESRELSRRGAVLRKQQFRPPVQDAIRPASLPEYIYEAVC